MANYENAGAAIDAIASGDAGMSPDIAAAIIAALGGTAAAATDATAIASTAITDSNVGSISSEGIVANEGVQIDADFNDTPVVAVVTGVGANENNIDMSEKSDDVAVVLSGGTGDSVETGSGNDSIQFRGGSATIDTGEGHDTVVLSGDSDGVLVTSGAGNGLFQFISDFIGAASVVAGAGFDRVSFGDAHRGEFRFGVLSNGHFSLSKTGNTRADLNQIDMDGVNVVSFDGNDDGVIDSATVLATTQAQSLVAKLYHVALGRDVVDSTAAVVDGRPVWTGVEDPTAADYQMGGINWWIEQASDTSEIDLAQMFVGTEEFQNIYKDMSSSEIVQKMFDNANATTVNGKTVADFAANLDDGSITIAQLAMDVALSEEATALLGLNGEQYVIDNF